MVGVSDAVVWHDVECGSYAVDLPLWRELADRAPGRILDLGAGTGRVALDLAAAGHRVTALDSDNLLLASLAERAAQRGLDVVCVGADARALPTLGAFALVIAPMQLLQILGGAAERAALLGGVASSLATGGRFAAAIAELEQSVAPDDAATPVPDVAEHEGWVYSSLPLDVRPQARGVAVERLRQRVSPGGALEEERHTQLLDALTVEQLEREAAAHGLVAVERREIPSTADHVGSMVSICRR
jgi:SAM-dependent methyltransferase